MPAFVPKFDVKETDSFYELDGELPGVQQSDIELEFVDNITLSINGHTMRSLGQPVHTNFKKATVEDVDTNFPNDERGTTTTGPECEIADVSNAKSSDTALVAETSDSEPKYLITERTFGDFERRFTFPVSINQDDVRASMKNGILTIIVPKAETSQKRKITIT